MTGTATDARPTPPRATAKRRTSRAIDRNPLEKGDRRLFEKGLLGNPRLNGPLKSLLRVLLDEFFWGRADCYPSIRKIVEESGFPERSVQRYLSELARLGIIVRVIDRSILPVQRRFILSTHPNAAVILAELRANPNVEFMATSPARLVKKTSPQMRLRS